MRAGIGVLQLQIGDHGELIHKRRQGEECRRKFGEAPRAWRSPLRDMGSHRYVHKTQAAHRIGRRGGQGGHGRNHGIQQRQRKGRAHAPQKRSPR